MSGIIAAVILKAKIIIAVDIVESRLALAKELGATHAINGRDKDVKEQILKITGRGLDFTLVVHFFFLSFCVNVLSIFCKC